MKRFGLFFLIILLVSSLAGAAGWEGTGTVSSSGLLPDEGYYVATNAFPRNTVVDLTNMETRKTVRVIVASGLESPGMLAMVSRDAANAIGLTNTAIGRIRISTPNDIGFVPGLREDRVSRSGDPDHDSLAAVTQRTGTIPSPESAATLPDQPAFVYPEEVHTQIPEETGNAAAENPPAGVVDVPETYPPSMAVIDDDSVVAELPPQPTWVYPQEIDETREINNAPNEYPDDAIVIVPEPETDDDPAAADVPSDPLPLSPIIIDTPKEALAELPETSDPPVLTGEDDPSVTLIPSQTPVSAEDSGKTSSAAVVSPPPSEEVYENPQSTIAVMEPHIPTAEDFPETSNPPMLIGSGDPSVTVISSEIPPVQPAPFSPEETYEVPETSIAVVEPGISEDDAPEAFLPPDPDTVPDPETAAIEPEPPAAAIVEVENPETETELVFVPTSERPPESSPYDSLPSDSEISPLPETSPSGNAVISHAPSEGPRFSVPEIFSLENGYYVQLGAFSETNSVEQIISDIGPSYPLKVQSAKNSSGSLYRVLVGPVNIGEGSALLQRFKTKGYRDSFIIPPTGY